MSMKTGGEMFDSVQRELAELKTKFAILERERDSYKERNETLHRQLNEYIGKSNDVYHALGGWAVVKARPMPEIIKEIIAERDKLKAEAAPNGLKVKQLEYDRDLYKKAHEESHKRLLEYIEKSNKIFDALGGYNAVRSRPMHELVAEAIAERDRLRKACADKTLEEENKDLRDRQKNMEGLVDRLNKIGAIYSNLGFFPKLGELEPGGVQMLADAYKALKASNDPYRKYNVNGKDMDLPTILDGYSTSLSLLDAQPGSLIGAVNKIKAEVVRLKTLANDGLHNRINDLEAERRLWNEMKGRLAWRLNTMHDTLEAGAEKMVCERNDAQKQLQLVQAQLKMAQDKLPLLKETVNRVFVNYGI